MKKIYSLLATALLMSMGAFAQKDEFKTLKKIYDKDKPSSKDVVQYKEAIVAASSLVSASNEADVVYLNFYKAVTPFIEMTEAMAKPENQGNPQSALKFFTPAKIGEFSQSAEAVLAYEKKSGKSVFTKDIQEMVVMYKSTLVSYAINLATEKRYADASSVLNSMYQMDPTDAEKLYYAASYSVSANDYDLALGYYLKLKELNYSGEKMNYMAISKLNDQEEPFFTKEDRDRAVKIGTHTDSKDEKESSKRGEIYKNIALIYISQGKTELAKEAILEARKVNPEDTSLMLSEADLYLKINDMATYSKLIKELLEKDPNNADLVYNLGVVSSQNKDKKNAEIYFLKAIELKPDYANAYYNIASLRLDEGQALLEEMNKLGMSAAENKKYDALKDKRTIVIKEAAVLLEKTISLDNKISDTKEVLLSVYKALEMKEKAKALEAEMNK
jgi:tetratricopeptide (TPR) repeat protein